MARLAAAMPEVAAFMLALLEKAACCQCRQLTGSAPEQVSSAKGVCSLRGSKSCTRPAANTLAHSLALTSSAVQFYPERSTVAYSCSQP